MFLPTTRREMAHLGWDWLDVILVTGDSYIDSPLIGVAVIGKVLAAEGYRVGVIAQPDLESDRDIGRLGEPRLFWGVTAGSIDSMVANYTPLEKRRRSDDYTPGGRNDRRPDRAAIVYANLIRRFFKRTRPIVLGGMEASLRRVPHYDYWSDRVRRSILFDAKADFLLYGMAERSVRELADRLREGREVRDVRGLCYIARAAEVERIRGDYIELPPYETVSADKSAFTEMFHIFYRNNDPITAKGLIQRHGDRYLVHNPPASYLSQGELDAVYGLDFERAQHPYYERAGEVKALETIRFSIATHRGCYGECNFCAIGVHEGRQVRWRSPESILAEAERLTRHPEFKGYISDLGGPTANMYGIECRRKTLKGSCPEKRCLYPKVCPSLKPDHSRQVELLRRVREIGGIKKAFIGSGIRHDLLLSDKEWGLAYLQELVEHHVSGQLKIAPEHTEEHVLQRMGKPPVEDALRRFKGLFDRLSRAAGKRQFLTYYLIAAHPGCTEADMENLRRFFSHYLKMSPNQVQIFTPTPSTYSSLMYYTERDPFTGAPLFVEKSLKGKERQKAIVQHRAGGDDTH